MRRITSSRDFTVSLSRTCRCYCKYRAFAPHRAHLYAPDEVDRAIRDTSRRGAKELLVLMGEQPEVNPRWPGVLRDYGHTDFMSYGTWACGRALKRGMLPHTKLWGAAARRPGTAAQSHGIARADARAGGAPAGPSMYTTNVAGVRRDGRTKTRCVQRTTMLSLRPHQRTTSVTQVYIRHLSPVWRHHASVPATAGEFLGPSPVRQPREVLMASNSHRRDSYGRLLNGETERLVVDLAPVVEPLMSRVEELMARQATVLRERMPSYGPRSNFVPDEALLPSAQRNVVRAVRTLRDGRPPSPEQMEEAWVARERTEQGLPAGEMLDAYRLAHRVIRDAFLDAAAEEHIDNSVVVRGACLLWETVDAGTSQLYAVRRELELALARVDEEQRISFLQNLLRGSIDVAALREMSAAYGLELDRQYLAVRGRPHGSTSPQALRRQLERSSRQHGLDAFLSIVDGEVLGIVPRKPSLDEVQATVGVSSPSHLTATDQSFRAASRMLDVATRFNAVGVFDLNDLRLRVAIAAEPELGKLLARRYVAPLHVAGDFGAQLETSVREYLVDGRQLARTARRLGIHSNTLRYRLHRFEEIVGVSLDDPQTLAELWWALENRVLEQAGHTDDGS